jgi:hypothetical protein
VSSSGSGLLFAIRNVTGGVVGGVPPSSTAGPSGANGKAPPPPPRPDSGSAEPTQQQEPSFDSQQQPPPFGQQSDWGQQQQGQHQEQQGRREPTPEERAAFRRMLFFDLLRAFVLTWLFVFGVGVPIRSYWKLREGAKLPYEERLKRRAAARELLKRMGREEMLQQDEARLQWLLRDTAAKIALLRAQMGVGLNEPMEGGEETAAALIQHARPELRMALWSTVAFHVLIWRAHFLLLEAMVNDKMIVKMEEQKAKEAFKEGHEELKIEEELNVD